MNRRAFLGRVFGVVAAAVVAPAVAVLPAPTPSLAFRRDAFALDFDTGIAVRFVQQFDVTREHRSRLDVFCGTGEVVIT